MSDPQLKAEFDAAVKRAGWTKKAATHLALRLAIEELADERPEDDDDRVARVMAKRGRR